MEQDKKQCREEVGQRLKQIRTQKDKSRYYVSKNGSLPFQLVNSIEDGQTNYKIDSLLNYLDSLGYYFISRNPDKNIRREEIGCTLAQLRAQLGKSRYNVAKNGSLTQHIVGGIETGVKNYTINSLYDYLDSLGKDVFSFIGCNNNEPSCQEV